MGLDDEIAILAAAPVFEFFDSGALRLLTFAGERVLLEPGERLFERGDKADGGFIVLSGTVELKGPGGTPVLAGRSALIGRTALFAKGKRPTDAVATSSVELMRITTQLMTRVLKEFPDAATAIYDWLADDLGELSRGLETVRARLTDTKAR
ncbi:cyclic nucleotide-binding domain-containing protein [Methylobacterium brachythecii]|uniref:CRP-like cAMP-binding protein n=1 Tax=Methylobacterium brachythecii TaxID=1176177 RepID=A0A7W6F576_9HYPH|nr:Crp/Fnr family transcriptional regulator [Methylobacterium brachythecii]MBB3900606.1 CRP-like cAMP-binding protein [Methylobacterium brachythecii]GLS43482.1 hypothetical protein GCM10007884_14670 [Methylobacterium brachythecii]